MHGVAESERFVTALLDGVLPLEGYVALAVQHYFIYAALETAAEAMREDPMAAPFVDDALHRLATLEADLTFLVGPDWAEKISPIPATAAYARASAKPAPPRRRRTSPTTTPATSATSPAA